MGRRRAGEAEAEWRARLESWDASGLSLRAFALREGVKPRTLWTWKKRLRGVATPATTFASVVLNGSSSAPAGTFELVVREGMALRIPTDFDEAALTRLVMLLGRA